MIRIDGRTQGQIRDVKITPDYLKDADGSVLIEVGHTKVICTASISNKVPNWISIPGQGWLTAEYSMLPCSSNVRIVRESVRGRIGGRTHEIQRLIGRSLRSVLQLERLGEKTVMIDCDVIQADGGTRTASISGAFVALVLAMKRLKRNNKIGKLFINDFLAAVSVGIVEKKPVLDLCYLEDAQAEVDMNVVMTGSGKFVEVQGTAEGTPFDDAEMNSLIELAKSGIEKMFSVQKEILQIDSFENE